jgi:uncharacterized protein (DUF305 family)
VPQHRNATFPLSRRSTAAARLEQRTALSRPGRRMTLRSDKARSVNLDELVTSIMDQMWLEMMIAHHEGAVSQSETVKADGSNPDVLLLADQIIAAQQGEIAEMQALLGN